MAPQVDSPLARAAPLVEDALRACEAYRRPDLATALTAARRRLADPAIHIVVMGEFKQGKSSLVNALIGGRVCPVDDDVATAVPTYVRYGAEPAAELIYEGDPPRREPVPLDQVRSWVVEGGAAAGSRPAGSGGASGAGGGPGDSASGAGGGPGDPARLAGVEVRLPRQLLAQGLVLVDTPGVGGLGSTHAAASLAASSMADALLFVTDAAQELTASELKFLRQARELCPTVACVLSKTDLYPAWRKIRDLNRQHLASEPDTPVIPVSAHLGSQAVGDTDPELAAESGFQALAEFVGKRVAGGATERLASEVATAVATTCEQLVAQFKSEQAALADPTEAARVVSELTAVKQRVETLKSAAAKWSQTLSDGFADLNSDIDHDLRERIRQIIAEADDAVTESDPADTWPQMQTWLESRVAGEMLANYTLLRDRATTLSEQVGEHFHEAAGQVLKQFPVANPAALATSVDFDDKLDLDRMGKGKQAMVALKAGYGGAIMFVMLGFMTGISLGPLALGIGLIMGHRGLREEKRRQVTSRQTQAKNAVRRYCDQVSFVMSKDSRDTLRRIQRELRDHYTAIAEQLNSSNAEALRAATEASKRNQSERERRLREIDTALLKLRELRQRANAVVQ